MVLEKLRELLGDEYQGETMWSVDNQCTEGDRILLLEYLVEINILQKRFDSIISKASHEYWKNRDG